MVMDSVLIICYHKNAIYVEGNINFQYKRLSKSKFVRINSIKEVILSADGDSIVYLVPDDVADNLEEYCLEFCSNWLRYSPDPE